MGKTVIRARPRGPLLVEGEIELYDRDGNPVDLKGRKRVALCRCGQSKSRPLCDGSHNRVRFDEDPKPEGSASESDSGRNRRLGDGKPDPELWAALGEGKLLRIILADFYDRVYKDPKLAPFFHGVTKDWAIDKQYNFLADKFSGQKLYFGDRPRNAHHWMVISNELFDYREALMADCARRAGLPEHLIERWGAFEEIFRKQIVKNAPFPRKIRGKEIPFEGYEEVELALDFMCDGCEEEILAGEKVHSHKRTGRTYCTRCVPDRSLRHDIQDPLARISPVAG